jgi:predicted RNase H-like HicB family nuclease
VSEQGIDKPEAADVAPTTYDVHLEQAAEGATLALILEFPGCFANGATREEALERLQQAVVDYQAWLRRHDDYTPEVRGPFAFEVKEVFQIRFEGDEEINSFFTPDAQTASEEDIEWALALMKWQREDLLERVGGLNDAALDWVPSDALPDARSIRSILDHLAQAEVWYMGRLDEAPPSIIVANLPGPTLDRLQRVRQAAIVRITSYPKELRGKIYTHRGEQWTLRKALRRVVWHERDHLNEIDELLQAYQSKQ